MKSVREAINLALDEELANDKSVFIIGEEVGESDGAYKVTKGLLKKYGARRVIDTPISENAFTGFGIGASYMGMRPIVEFMTFNFSLQAIDHIINSCAKISYMSGSVVTSPIVFRGISGYDPGCAAQHCMEFFSFYGQIPGLKVVAPVSMEDHYNLTKLAIRDDNPVIILENHVLYDENISFKGGEDYNLDKARIVRNGNKATVIGFSYGLTRVVEACKNIEGVEIINLISIRPLDMKIIISSVRKTRKLLIVDFSTPCFSVASEISSQVYEMMFGELDKKIVKLNAKDGHVPYAANLEENFYPSVDEIRGEVLKLMC